MIPPNADTFVTGSVPGGVFDVPALIAKRTYEYLPGVGVGGKGR
jgi:hypothetical protein